MKNRIVLYLARNLRMFLIYVYTSRSLNIKKNNTNEGQPGLMFYMGAKVKALVRSGPRAYLTYVRSHF